MEFDKPLFFFFHSASKMYKECEKRSERKWKQVKVVQFNNCEAKAVALAAAIGIS